jgi:hypothetical protein
MAVWYSIEELTCRGHAGYLQSSEGHGCRLGGPYNTQDGREKRVARITGEGRVEITKSLAKLIRVVALLT